MYRRVCLIIIIIVFFTIRYDRFRDDIMCMHAVWSIPPRPDRLFRLVRQTRPVITKFGRRVPVPSSAIRNFSRLCAIKHDSELDARSANIDYRRFPTTYRRHGSVDFSSRAGRNTHDSSTRRSIVIVLALRRDNMYPNASLTCVHIYKREVCTRRGTLVLTIHLIYLWKQTSRVGVEVANSPLCLRQCI